MARQSSQVPPPPAESEPARARPRAASTRKDQSGLTTRSIGSSHSPSPFRDEIPPLLRRLHEPDVGDEAAFLNDVANRLESTDCVQSTMQILCDGLWWIRKLSPPHRWQAFLALAQTHRVASLVHQDLFTHRSFSKPRGYAGDAALIDFMYYDQGFANLESLSTLGRKIFEHNRDAPAPMAVRERRDFMAALIDETCAEQSSASLLSLACGHLREGLLSDAVDRSAFGRFVAVDQDAASLGVVRQHFAAKGVEARQLSIKRFLASDYPAQSFDFIYASGLFDYLQDRFAQSLVESLFDLLRPGGRLIVANFVPDIYDVGYMEAYMGWHLIYRDGAQLMKLAQRVPDSDASLKRTYTRRSPDIIYLEIRKRRNGSAISAGSVDPCAVPQHQSGARTVV